MPDFRFRLATLQRLRAADRDEKRAHLAEAQKAEQILREQAEDTNREIDDIHRVTRAATAGGPVDVNRVLDARRYEVVLRARLVQLREQTERVRQEVERRRQVVVEADRQVRILDKLREQQWSDHQLQELLAEQKEMDEMASRTGTTARARA